MSLCPSSAQIHEMLELTRQSRTQSHTNFTFGAFSFYAAEMRHFEKRSNRYQRRRLSCGSPSLMHRCSYDVFLGGACNPTKWRQEQAIPALKQAKVTYYNPQIEDWRPNLIDLENQAKNNAKVLLFVHVKETRALASMVEVAERSALGGKQLVIAVEDQGDTVNNEVLTEREKLEMSRARNHMRDIAELRRVRVYTDVKQAVQSCINIVQSKESCESPPHNLNLGENYIKSIGAFDNHATDGKLSRTERDLSFRVLNGTAIPDDLSMKDKKFIDDSDFLQINAEHRTNTSKSMSGRLFAIQSLLKSPASKCSNITNQQNDIFICGPTGAIDWKTKMAEPLFDKHHIPHRRRVNEESKHFMPIEMDQIGNYKVLLFVFPSDTWGASEMIMASYYIALKKRVVVCIQQLSKGTMINGEPCTETQEKDYNRCRMYLSDQAIRHNAPVFGDIRDAVEKAVELARN